MLWTAWPDLTHPTTSGYVGLNGLGRSSKICPVLPSTFNSRVKTSIISNTHHHHKHNTTLITRFRTEPDPDSPPHPSLSRSCSLARYAFLFFYLCLLSVDFAFCFCYFFSVLLSVHSLPVLYVLCDTVLFNKIISSSKKNYEKCYVQTIWQTVC
jgi:hypothetical protein